MKNLILLFLIIISSCTIEQHIHINKDGSGHVNYSLLITGGNSWDDLLNSDSSAIEEDSPEIANDTMVNVMKEFGDKLSAITGVSNVKVETNSKEGKYGVGFDFANIAVLNKAYSENAGDAPKLVAVLKLEKKKFTFEPVITEKAKENADSDGLSELFKYNLTFSFEKKVKKVSNKNFVISDDKHSVTYKGSLEDITNGKTAVVVKLKN